MIWCWLLRCRLIIIIIYDKFAESLEKKENKLQAKKATEKARQEEQLKEAERLREAETKRQEAEMMERLRKQIAEEAR